MKYAAIDIGTNAIRLLIEEVFELDNNEFYFKKISLTRVPIRLGTDVFSKKEIGEKNAKSVFKCMKAFEHLMDINEVVDFKACATSAMREAKNGKEIRDKIFKKTGIDIEIISGEEEANLILDNFHMGRFDHSKTYLYIKMARG